MVIPEANRFENIRLRDLIRESEITIRQPQRFILFGNHEAQMVSNEAGNFMQGSKPR